MVLQAIFTGVTCIVFHSLNSNGGAGLMQPVRRNADVQFAYYATPTNFENAKEHCATEHQDGTLAILNDRVKLQQFKFALISHGHSQKEVWIGASLKSGEDVWKWINGKKVTEPFIPLPPKAQQPGASNKNGDVSGLTLKVQDRINFVITSRFVVELKSFVCEYPA